MPRYAERTLGRQLAFQFLFSLEFVDTPWEQALAEFWHMEPNMLAETACAADEIPAAERPFADKGDLRKAKRYAKKLVQGVCENREDLDMRITASLDNWAPERVGRTEWVIVRLALYELLYGERTPETVVIAEAVQLTNIFGDVEAPRFVNGLLDKLTATLPDAATAGDGPDKAAP